MTDDATMIAVATPCGTPRNTSENTTIPDGVLLKPAEIRHFWGAEHLEHQEHLKSDRGLHAKS